jgi:hypothetical protein
MVLALPPPPPEKAAERMKMPGGGAGGGVSLLVHLNRSTRFATAGKWKRFRG